MVERTSIPEYLTVWRLWECIKTVGPSACLLDILLTTYLGVMKSRVKNKDVTAHVFEYTTTFALDPDLHFKYPDKGVVPTQIVFCLKEKNAKKINSHRWFFNAFGRSLQVRDEAVFMALVDIFILAECLYFAGCRDKTGRDEPVSHMEGF
jgi:cellulose synthase/poly-beta-1,6-N-acetylglucosamine synthase-like glycosyltransferase